jgi:cytochrome P450
MPSRFDSSVIACCQKTKLEAEIGDVRLPADARLLLLLGSANRDPAVFYDLDQFDIRRPNAREHLSFGFGPRTCLGAPLAWLEARIVLEEVGRRLPTLRLAQNERLELLDARSTRVTGHLVANGRPHSTGQDQLTSVLGAYR